MNRIFRIILIGIPTIVISIYFLEFYLGVSGGISLYLGFIGSIALLFLLFTRWLKSKDAKRRMLDDFTGGNEIVGNENAYGKLDHTEHESGHGEGHGDGGNGDGDDGSGE